MSLKETLQRYSRVEYINMEGNAGQILACMYMYMQEPNESKGTRPDRHIKTPRSTNQSISTCRRYQTKAKRHSKNRVPREKRLEGPRKQKKSRSEYKTNEILRHCIQQYRRLNWRASTRRVNADTRATLFLVCRLFVALTVGRRRVNIGCSANDRWSLLDDQCTDCGDARADRMCISAIPQINHSDWSGGKRLGARILWRE